MIMRRHSSHKLQRTKWRCVLILPPKATPTVKLKGTALFYTQQVFLVLYFFPPFLLPIYQAISLHLSMIYVQLGQWVIYLICPQVIFLEGKLFPYGPYQPSFSNSRRASAIYHLSEEEIKVLHWRQYRGKKAHKPEIRTTPDIRTTPAVTRGIQL